MFKILFVCLGNICRSPTADAICQHLIKESNLEGKVSCDSAGTSAHHVGERPDSRSVKYAKSQGIDMTSLRSRQMVSSDFQDFDLILAMDSSNFEHIRSIQPNECRAKVAKLLDYADTGSSGCDVPDPYYGGAKGFKVVYDMCYRAIDELLKSLKH